jgi:hypothetical protein
MIPRVNAVTSSYLRVHARTCGLSATALQVLASYGIAGDISIPALNEYYREVSLSLLHPTDPFAGGAAVRYCSPLPAPLGRPGTVTTGADFLRHLATGVAKCGPDLDAPLRRASGGTPDIDYYPQQPTTMQAEVRSAASFCMVTPKPRLSARTTLPSISSALLIEENGSKPWQQTRDSDSCAAVRVNSCS